MVSRIDKMFGDFVAASLAIDGGGGNDGEVDVAPAPAPRGRGAARSRGARSRGRARGFVQSDEHRLRMRAGKLASSRQRMVDKSAQRTNPTCLRARHRARHSIRRKTKLPQRPPKSPPQRPPQHPLAVQQCVVCDFLDMCILSCS